MNFPNFAAQYRKMLWRLLRNTKDLYAPIWSSKLSFFFISFNFLKTLTTRLENVNPLTRGVVSAGIWYTGLRNFPKLSATIRTFVIPTFFLFPPICTFSLGDAFVHNWAYYVSRFPNSLHILFLSPTISNEYLSNIQKVSYSSFSAKTNRTFSLRTSQ